MVQTEIANELLGKEIPQVRALLQHVIDHQHSHIEAIKLNQTELRNIVRHLMEVNSKSLKN